MLKAQNTHTHTIQVIRINTYSIKNGGFQFLLAKQQQRQQKKNKETNGTNSINDDNN